MNKHRIAISMEDSDIERTSTTLIITTEDNLATVSDKLNTAFRDYDYAEGIALEYREAYGWGTDGFIEYLNRIYGDWTIEEEIPDATLEFIGM